MIGIFLALFAAFAYSLSAVLTRKNLDKSNYFSVTFAVVVIGNVVLWPLALAFTDLKAVNFQGILFFMIAGMLAPGITRILYNKGMETLGVAVNASIFATYPMYSTILAILLLGENIAYQNWIGLTCIVSGVMLIERGFAKYTVRLKRTSKKNLLFPLFATLAIASSQPVRKYGLSIFNEPLLGAAVGYFSALLLYLVIVKFSKNLEHYSFFGKEFKLFWKPGVCLASGWVLTFYALSYERVSIIIPIIQTEPLFILFLTYLYLKELEHISFRTVISTFLIVIGIILVSTK